MGAFDGKTAIVTGSTGEGMGRQIAWNLAKGGANVVLNYGTYRKGAAAAEKVRKECETLGGHAIAVRADTRKEKDVEALVAKATDAFGGVDIAVANAGGDYLERPVEKLTQAEWHKVVLAEIDGAFLLAREVLPGMRRRRYGRLVFIGWDRALSGPSGPLDYAVGKAGREAIARSLARAERKNGVTVNVVAPGPYEYPSDSVARQLLAHGKAWNVREAYTHQDVAEAVLWLCSDEARFVTGSRLELPGPPTAG